MERAFKQCLRRRLHQAWMQGCPSVRVLVLVVVEEVGGCNLMTKMTKPRGNGTVSSWLSFMSEGTL